MPEMNALATAAISSRRSNRRIDSRPLFRIFALAIALLILAAAYGRFRFGSVSAALAYIRGERLLVEAPVKSVRGNSSGIVEVSYSLTNWTDHPVRLIGAEVTCSCTAINDIPMTLAASEAKAVKATINTSEINSDLSGTIRLFTDDASHPEIKLGYVVHVSYAQAIEAK